MDLGEPLFLLNLKAYPSCLGNGALILGKDLEAAAQSHSVKVALAPPMPLLALLARELTIPVVSQHADALAAGARTGHVPPAALAAVGSKGCLVNHSEHALDREVVQTTVRLLKEEGLIAIVCAKDVEDAVVLAQQCQPPYLAIEPPELIGGDVSVSKARPEVVSGTVEAVRKVSPQTRVLCGAGIKDREDVRKALQLGARGVLVASAIATAKDPKGALHELLSGFPRP